jgi:transposase-like protein
MKKQYDREFNLQMRKEIIEAKTTVSEVAKEYSIYRSIFARWASEYRRYKNKDFSGKGTGYLTRLEFTL